MDYRRMKLFSYRAGYDLRDHGCHRSARSARDFAKVVARRIRKQIKARDRRERDVDLRPDHRHFSMAEGRNVERFWEACDPDWALA